MPLCLVSYCPDSAERTAATINADYWYKAQHWARTTAIGCLILIALLGILNRSRQYVSRRPRKLTAALRAVGYSHIKFIDLSLGFVLGCFTLFMALFIWCFQTKPYYRPGVEYGSAPLGIRTGYIATALVPFVFAMGSRINPLAFVTRIEASRWMLWHQYGARVILFFSVIHTFVLLYAPYRQGGISWTNAYWSKSNKWENFFNTDGVMINGALAIAALFWIVFSSFAKIRNWNYEFFILQHLASILIFTISLWPHVKVSIPDAQYYVFASVATWCFSIAVRAGWNFMEAAGVGKWSGTASLHGFGADGDGRGGATRLVIKTKRGGWEVGQYVYLWVPAINPFQSHPFTIASSPPTNPSTPSPLNLLISTRSGLTKRIAQHASSNPSRAIPVVVQGPFGGLMEDLERFDNVLVVCGGVGAAMGWSTASQVGRHGGNVRLIWSMKTIDCLSWFEQDSSFDRSNLTIHITGTGARSSSSHPKRLSTEKTLAEIEAGPLRTRTKEEPSQTPFTAQTASSTGDEEEKDLLPSTASPNLVYERCRIKETVRAFASQMSDGERLAVIVCGPVSMLADTANAVASLEWDIARGKSSLGEVWMHKERFGW
ncbi:hypothetical protein B9479_002962 [Cryptococcus floricola]|uniref:ferric-chelate reductase (NADPH) n=1 Tax=Cryptococcus floricola TaxID=2591691 RepID=A0A5D3B255_9TREE|nr:hypothetical protein B9479_002962 [Cryptococcus floricola]